MPRLGLISDDDRAALERALFAVPSVRQWFDASRHAEPGSLDFRVAYARATRKLGSEGKNALSGYARAGGFGTHWTLLDGARWLLVVHTLSRIDAEPGAGFVYDLFSAGDFGEQVSLLRTLGALPDPERFSATGIEACRTNSIAVFEAIACENPYPAAWFPELAWNQMVIKAIFLELSVDRIVGLDERITSELLRMAEGLKSERRAAGRPVPVDINSILTRAKPP